MLNIRLVLGFIVLCALGIGAWVAQVTKSKQATAHRSVVSEQHVRWFIVCCVFVLSAAAVAVLVYSLIPATDIESADGRATQLVAEAGGPTKVCEEGNQLFAEFGVSKERFLYPEDLGDYPALGALGTVHIFPDNPSFILVRVGTHLDGASIIIADMSSPSKFAKSSSTVELVDSCVFVRR